MNAAYTLTAIYVEHMDFYPSRFCSRGSETADTLYLSWYHTSQYKKCSSLFGKVQFNY